MQLNTYSWLQYEASPERPCDLEVLGFGWTAQVQVDVGTLLPRGERYCVCDYPCGWKLRSANDRPDTS
jgi:hypothetical protein